MKRWCICWLLAAALLRTAAPDVRAAVLSAMPGERVECRAVFQVRGGGEYVARSRLSDGVELRDVAALRCDGERINASFYTTVERREAGEKQFEIHFAAGWAEAKEVDLEINYSVSLNDRAGTGELANRCAVELLTADGRPLCEEELFVSTGAFSLYRAVELPDSARRSNPLYGAGFSLYRDRERTRRMTFAESRSGEYTACAGDGCRHTRHTCLLKTPPNGTIRLQGLPAGTYYLQETRPPQGYGVTADALEIRIGEDGSVTSGGTRMPEGMIPLVERPRTEPKTERKKDPLAFYETGCKVLSTVLAALLMARRRLFC